MPETTDVKYENVEVKDVIVDNGNINVLGSNARYNKQLELVLFSIITDERNYEERLFRAFIGKSSYALPSMDLGIYFFVVEDINAGEEVSKYPSVTMPEACWPSFALETEETKAQFVDEQVSKLRRVMEARLERRKEMDCLIENLQELAGLLKGEVDAQNSSDELDKN